MNGKQRCTVMLGVLLVTLIWPALALAQDAEWERVNRQLRTTDFMDDLPWGQWKSDDYTGRDISGISGWACSGARCYLVMGPSNTEYFVELPDHVKERAPGGCGDFDEAQIRKTWGRNPAKP